MFKVIILLAVFAVLGAQAHWHFKVSFGRDNAEETTLIESPLSAEEYSEFQSLYSGDSGLENLHSRRHLAWKILRHGLPLLMLDSEN